MFRLIVFNFMGVPVLRRKDIAIETKEVRIGIESHKVIHTQLNPLPSTLTFPTTRPIRLLCGDLDNLSLCTGLVTGLVYSVLEAVHLSALYVLIVRFG